MTFTISADDPKTIRAIEIAAEADHWLRGRNAAGQEVVAVPSQSDASRYYIVTDGARCDCPDFRHGEASSERGDGEVVCKHVLAVRLHAELVRAQEEAAQSSNQAPGPTRRRGHLTLV